MGHHISAIIGKAPIDKEKASEYDLSIFEENGFVIVALDPSHLEYWDEKLNYGYEKVSEIFMDNKSTHFFAEQIGLSEFAIISTDYLGGVGSQESVSYRVGTQTSIHFENGINETLRTIGVKKVSTLDEFETIGLSKYRNWDGLFDKYEDL